MRHFHFCNLSLQINFGMPARYQDGWRRQSASWSSETWQDVILSLMTAKNVRARPRTVEMLVSLRHCSDGSVSVKCDAEFASLVPQVDVLLANFVQQQLKDFFKNLCPCRQAFVFQFTHPFACSGNHVGLVHLLGASHQCRTEGPEEVSVPTRKHAIMVGIRLLPSSPRSRSQTEVVAPLRQCSTVPDVENHVLFTFCTNADSGNASSCSDPAQSDQNCLDPSVKLDAIGIGSSASSSACGPIGICNSHQLSPGVPSASLRRRTNLLPFATVFGCVLFEFCQERKVYL